MSFIPRQHVFVTTNQIRVPQRAQPSIDLGYDQWKREDARVNDYNARKRVRAFQHEVVQELIDSGLINMKSVNRAFSAKTNTPRKKLVNRLIPNINDYKRDTYAFAYVGDGYFLTATAEQHDNDQFSRKAGRDTAYKRLDGEISFFTNLFKVDQERALSRAIHASELEDRTDIPKKVRSEMVRMLQDNSSAWAAHLATPGTVRTPVAEIETVREEDVREIDSWTPVNTFDDDEDYRYVRYGRPFDI